MDLKIFGNIATNALTLDLTNYIQVNDESMDPASPSFTDKVISHSLLREGGVLALSDLKNKELVFPLLLTGSSQTAVFQLIVKLNQILETPSATASWQDDGASQATIFDLIGGQFDVEYNYRKGQQAYTQGKLRLFTQPLGRTAAPRAYAAASGVGPLLMITPYASGGALAIGASTQAGVGGFGGAPMGASSGIFYPGAPSLAGDAPALVQLSYSFTGDGYAYSLPPMAAVSVLPDPYYQPEITVAQLQSYGYVSTISAAVVASEYITTNQFANVGFSAMLGASAGIEPTALWAGQHRIFALARASEATCWLLPSFEQPVLGVGPFALTNIGPITASVAVPPGPTWQLYDLGTISISPSQLGGTKFGIALGAATLTGDGSGLDLNALYMLPDSNTWFFNPAQPLVYYMEATDNTSRVLLLDDTIGAQFIYGPQVGASPYLTYAPSPIGMAASCTPVTQYSRGLVPRPDPKNGLPILSVLAWSPSQIGGSPLLTTLSTAQMTVVERARYVLP